MRVAVSDAKAQLTELVRRAEAGEEVILTRRGQPAVKLVPTAKVSTREDRSRALEEFRSAVRGKMLPGEDAAHSADFLYDEETGLPI
jgi:prevent-host-death family protein